MNITIDVDELRADLVNYFGTATSYNPLAMVDLIKVEKASDEEIVQIALKNGFDIRKYEVKGKGRK